MTRKRLRTACFGFIFLSGILRGGIAGEPADSPFTPRQLIPPHAVMAIRSPDPVRVIEFVLQRAGTVAGKPDIPRQVVDGMNGMLAALGQEPANDLRGVARGLGFDPTRPAVLGLVARAGDVALPPLPDAMFFCALPIANRPLVEALIVQQYLPAQFRRVFHRCRRTRRVLIKTHAARKALRENPEGPMDTEAMLALPGYGGLRCLTGGTLAYEPRRKEIVCKNHPTFTLETFKKAVARGLPEERIGGLTLVGDPALGVGYAEGEGYLILAEDFRLLRALVRGSQRRRRDVLLPAAGLLQMRVHWGTIGHLLQQAWQRSPRVEEGVPLAQERFLSAMRNLPPLLFALKAADDGLVLDGTQPLEGSPWAKRARSIPPALSTLAALLPPEAPVALHTNLLPEMGACLAQALAAFGDREAVLAQMVPLLLGREAAWSLGGSKTRTPWLGKHMPHMHLLVSRDSPEVAQALDLLPETIGALHPGLSRLQTAQSKAGEPYMALRLREPADADPILCYYAIQPFSAFLSSPADLDPLLARMGKLGNKDGEAAGLRSPAFRELGGPPRPSNLTLFLNAPALFKHIAVPGLRLPRNDEVGLYMLGQWRIEGAIENNALHMQGWQRSIVAPPPAPPAEATPPPEGEVDGVF